MPLKTVTPVPAPIKFDIDVTSSEVSLESEVVRFEGKRKDGAAFQAALLFNQQQY
jgi:hypothetical protein